MSYITGGQYMPGSGLQKRAGVWEYSFALDGGAVGTIALRSVDGPRSLSAASIVVNSLVEVLTVPTSGGAATLAAQIEAANDVVNAAVISGAPWSTVGRKAGIPVSATTSLKTTAARNPSLVVGTAALTAGVIRLYAEWFDPRS